MQKETRYFYCSKCRGFIPHNVVEFGTVAICDNCGDEKDLANDIVIEAVKEIQGDPRDA